MGKGFKLTARSGSNRRWKGQQCVLGGTRWDYFVLPVPLPLPSDRGESGGLAFEGVSLPFPLPFPLPRPLPFPLPLGGAPMLREIGVVIEERAPEGLEGCGFVRRTLHGGEVVH